MKEVKELVIDRAKWGKGSLLTCEGKMKVNHDYYNQFVRYEPRGETVATKIQPVRVRKQMLNGKLTIVRMTECTFPRTESSSFSSIEVDGWGSCSVAGKWYIPPTREQLISTGFVREAGHGEPTLSLDWKAHRSHNRDLERMARGIVPEQPVEIQVCDCGACNECASRVYEGLTLTGRES